MKSFKSFTETPLDEGSLHKWFSGSKSKDGKPGWVQSDGSPCANEPGETKTPKCYSSAKRASMSKKELRSADARKSKKDPNQQQKSGAAKPTYVSTDKKKMKEDYYRGTGEKVIARTKKYMEKKGEKGAPGLDAMKARQKDHEAKRGVKKEENEVDECWKTHKKVGMKKKGGKMVPDCRPKTQVTTEAKVDKGRSDYGKASIRNYRRSGPDTLEPAMFDPDNKRGKTIDKRREEHKARRGVKGAKVPTYKKEEVVLEADKKEKGSGSKDACYHKVKARYSVWPSAYASGALVKCRKVGAANWGNKSEGYIPEEGYDVARDMGKVRPSKDKKDGTSYPPSEEMRKTQKVNKGPSAFDRVKEKYKGQIMDVKKEEVELDEKCWKGYEKKGMKTMFGKRYPNCVKKTKKENYSNWRDELELNEKVGGAGTLVRQGVKVGGKKGGRAVQKGQDMAVKAGQGAKETAKAGNKSKMVGSGKFEKAGALAGGVAGGLAGAVVDGPLPIGDIVGGIAGAKVGGKLGRQIDKIGAKKPMKEENIDEKLRFKTKDEFVSGIKAIPGNLNKFKEKIFPSPENSNNPSVSSGVRTPDTGFKHVPYITDKNPKNIELNKDGVYGQKGTDFLKDKGEKLLSKVSGPAKKLARGAVKGGVIGATALTGAALAKRLMKKSDKKESFSNWREEVGYEGKDDSKKLQEDDMKGMSVKSGHKRPTKSGAGMTQKGVEAYRRRNPGSKLKTAVTTKPSKLKKGSKAANRRKSYCARSAGQMKKFPKAAKDPNSRLRQARRRWNC